MQKALQVHQRKTKHFITKLFAQPFIVLQTLLKSMTTVKVKALHGESVILTNTKHNQSVFALVCLCGFYLPISPFFLPLSFDLNELTC